MNPYFIIKRKDTKQYYHSLTPRGYPLWCDIEEHAQYLIENEANNLAYYIRCYFEQYDLEVISI